MTTHLLSLPLATPLCFVGTRRSVVDYRRRAMFPIGFFFQRFFPDPSLLTAAVNIHIPNRISRTTLFFIFRSCHCPYTFTHIYICVYFPTRSQYNITCKYIRGMCVCVRVFFSIYIYTTEYSTRTQYSQKNFSNIFHIYTCIYRVIRSSTCVIRIYPLNV